MNLKAAYKYQITEHKKSIIVYYLILICIILTLTVSTTIMVNNGMVSSQFSGMESSSAIFLFVLGLCTFKETFHMFMQHGISRKTMFVSKILTMLSVGVFMSFIDKVILLLGKFETSFFSNTKWISLYEQIYSAHSGHTSAVLIQIESFIFNICLYIALISIGYFITILFYRLPKFGRVAISVGVPIGLFIILPFIDTTITDGSITHGIINALDFAFGISNQNPINSFFTLLLLFILFNGLSWLLLKKAALKEN